MAILAWPPTTSMASNISTCCPASTSVRAAAAPAHPAPVAPVVGDAPCNLEQLVADYEQQLLKRALECCRYNQRRAAEHLGLTYHQLRGYLRKYKLLPSDGE